MSLLRRIGTLFGRDSNERELPTPATAPAAPPPARAERRLRPRRNPRPGTRILLIDDSATIVAVLRKTLQSAKAETAEAFDAESGIALARENPPELVFLDVILPGMNGFAALRLFRRDPALHQVPVIMISGNEQAAEQFYANKIGADDFMKKPFTRTEVFTRIERLLDPDGVPRRVKAAEPA
jgi:DNA-binding response OmpR family regulator